MMLHSDQLESSLTAFYFAFNILGQSTKGDPNINQNNWAIMLLWSMPFLYAYVHIFISFVFY